MTVRSPPARVALVWLGVRARRIDAARSRLQKIQKNEKSKWEVAKGFVRL
ncbi:hypothetical protein QT971_19745 [Microcoleus sp. herbarium19]